MRNRVRAFRLLPLILLAAACSERPVLGPSEAELPEAPPTAPEGATLIVCDVTVPTGEMTCAFPSPRTKRGANGDIVIGGQDYNVLLANTQPVYDSGSEIFQVDVTLQNLTQQLLGTDGLTTSGLQVFFNAGPTMVSGTSGTVEVANEDGTADFLGTEQPYFDYGTILSPFEISEPKTWMFSVPSTVQSFSFSVYVNTTMVDEEDVLQGQAWEGTTSSDWDTAENWRDEALPTAASTATVLPLAMLEPSAFQPQLDGNIEVANLRIGTGSSLDLNGYTAQANGNVDAVGTISNGVVRMTGSGAVAGGRLPSLIIDGSTATQKAMFTSGAVSITGSLKVTASKPLSISLP